MITEAQDVVDVDELLAYFSPPGARPNIGAEAAGAVRDVDAPVVGHDQFRYESINLLVGTFCIPLKYPSRPLAPLRSNRTLDINSL